MSFANFLFYPLVIGTIVAVIIEQIFRARGDENKPEDVRRVFIFAIPVVGVYLGVNSETTEQTNETN